MSFAYPVSPPENPKPTDEYGPGYRELEYGLAPRPLARDELGSFTSWRYSKGVEEFFERVDEPDFYKGLGTLAAQHLGDTVPDTAEPYSHPKHWYSLRQRRTQNKVIDLVKEIKPKQAAVSQAERDRGIIEFLDRKPELKPHDMEAKRLQLKAEKAHLDPITYEEEYKHTKHVKKHLKQHSHKIFRTLEPGEKRIVSPTSREIADSHRLENARVELERRLAKRRGIQDRKIERLQRKLPRKLIRLKDAHNQWTLARDALPGKYAAPQMDRARQVNDAWENPQLPELPPRPVVYQANVHPPMRGNFIGARAKLYEQGARLSGRLADKLANRSTPASTRTESAINTLRDKKTRLKSKADDLSAKRLRLKTYKRPVDVTGWAPGGNISGPELSKKEAKRRAKRQNAAYTARGVGAPVRRTVHDIPANRSFTTRVKPGKSEDVADVSGWM